MSTSVAKAKRSTTRSPPAASLEELRGRIRNAGLRSTAPRIAVLRALGEATGPVSHGDLVETLMSAGFDRATLYRNLMDLTEAGLVTRSDLGDHVWRFELRSSGNDHAVEHPHFVCVECGSVSCLPGVNVRVRTTPEAPRSLTRRGFEVQLKGRCDACDTAAP